MSRLTGKDAKNLREAYAAVYAPQITEEQVWEEVEEWVNSLVEEGYDLSEYSWEELYETYIEEVWETGKPKPEYREAGRAQRATQQRVSLGVQKGADGRWTTYGTSDRPIGGARPTIGTGRGSSGDYQRRAAWDKNKAAREQQAKSLADRLNKEQGLNKPTQPPTQPPPKKEEPKKEEPRREPSRDAETRTPAPPARQPAGAPPAKPAGAASPSPKPAPAGQTGDKAKDMDTWAKANPKLAAAAAERQRIRGTQQTDNPLMKDFRSRLPMNSPSVQSPDVANLGKGFQSLTQNPNALKAAPAKPAPAASTPAKPTPAATSSTSNATTRAFQPGLDLRKSTSAATPSASTPAKPAPAATPAASTPAKPAPAATPAPAAATPAKKEPPTRKEPLWNHADLYDLVKGHLLDEGYADSEESALAIMANMSEEWRESIINENLVGAAKKTFQTVGNLVKSGVKKVTQPYIDASQKEQNMRHPNYNPRTGEIDPNFKPGSGNPYYKSYGDYIRN